MSIELEAYTKQYAKRPSHWRIIHNGEQIGLAPFPCGNKAFAVIYGNSIRYRNKEVLLSELTALDAEGKLTMSNYYAERVKWLRDRRARLTREYVNRTTEIDRELAQLKSEGHV